VPEPDAIYGYDLHYILTGNKRGPVSGCDYSTPGYYGPNTVPIFDPRTMSYQRMTEEIREGNVARLGDIDTRKCVSGLLYIKINGLLHVIEDSPYA